MRISSRIPAFAISILSLGGALASPAARAAGDPCEIVVFNRLHMSQELDEIKAKQALYAQAQDAQERRKLVNKLVIAGTLVDIGVLVHGGVTWQSAFSDGLVVKRGTQIQTIAGAAVLTAALVWIFTSEKRDQALERAAGEYVEELRASRKNYELLQAQNEALARQYDCPAAPRRP